MEDGILRDPPEDYIAWQLAGVEDDIPSQVLRESHWYGAIQQQFNWTRGSNVEFFISHPEDSECTGCQKDRNHKADKDI